MVREEERRTDGKDFKNQQYSLSLSLFL